MSSSARTRLVYSVVISKFETLSTDKSGCQVVQECIKIGNADMRKQLAHATQANIEVLINDEYGNFVV